MHTVLFLSGHPSKFCSGSWLLTVEDLTETRDLSTTLPDIGIMVSVRPWLGRPGFDLRSSYTKDSKMVLETSLLNTQHYKV